MVVNIALKDLDCNSDENMVHNHANSLASFPEVDLSESFVKFSCSHHGGCTLHNPVY